MVPDIRNNFLQSDCQIEQNRQIVFIILVLDRQTELVNRLLNELITQRLLNCSPMLRATDVNDVVRVLSSAYLAGIVLGLGRKEKLFLVLSHFHPSHLHLKLFFHLAHTFRTDVIVYSQSE